MNAFNPTATEAGISRTIAQRWVHHAWTRKEPKVLSRLRTQCARDLGRRTRWIPFATPTVMAILLASGGLVIEQWPAMTVLFLLMLSAAFVRCRLAGKLIDATARDASVLARGYGYAADIQAFTWGSICGVMLFSFGPMPLTVVALAATTGVVAAAYTTLTVETGMWLRFSAALWLPLLALILVTAMEGMAHGWLVFMLGAVYALISTLHGLRLVNDYIDGVLNRSRLEEAVSLLEAQRDALDAHQAEVCELADRAHKLSYYDQLTQLGSRSHFHERLNAAMLRHHEFGRPFALLHLDLNGFTDINDSLGHEAGDRLLQVVGQRIYASQRHDDFAARLGSDEFAILLMDVSELDAARLARQYRETIQLPARVGGKLITPSVSIGLSICPNDAAAPMELLKAAESAMHSAKQHRSLDYMRYTPSMSAAATQRLTIVQELRHALKSDQFELRYQPQFDAATSAFVGVEALIRWHHPEHGLIPPLDFIGVAEKCGLIHELGEWVLRTACAQAMRWTAEGHAPFCMAVNISPLQLLEPDFMVMLRSVLEHSGLPAELLELEITESAVQTHSEARQTLAQVRQLGVRVAIDDFGTGYSSLVSLKSLTVDRVKIDRAFVTDMLASARDTALLGTIIDMAHVLGATVVAEGVEQAAHVESLRRLGCDCLQGHYFSPAIEAEHIAHLAPHAKTKTTITDDVS